MLLFLHLPENMERKHSPKGFAFPSKYLKSVTVVLCTWAADKGSSLLSFQQYGMWTELKYNEKNERYWFLCVITICFGYEKLLICTDILLVSICFLWIFKYPYVFLKTWAEKDLGYTELNDNFSVHVRSYICRKKVVSYFSGITLAWETLYNL